MSKIFQCLAASSSESGFRLSHRPNAINAIKCQGAKQDCSTKQRTSGPPDEGKMRACNAMCCWRTSSLVLTASGCSKDVEYKLHVNNNIIIYDFINWIQLICSVLPGELNTFHCPQAPFPWINNLGSMRQVEGKALWWSRRWRWCQTVESASKVPQTNGHLVRKCSAEAHVVNRLSLSICSL